MRKVLLFLVMSMATMAGMAQTSEKADTLNAAAAQFSIFSSGRSDASLPENVPAFIGYLSYDSALVAMPQYAIVQAQMRDLREAYNQEVSRVENDFNQKYEAFLEGQKDFPRTILLKRQNELQELIQKNVAFKQQGLRDLQQAEEEAMTPLREQLAKAIADVAKEQCLLVVLNTDSNACPFIEPAVSIDIQEQVEALLKK